MGSKVASTKIVNSNLSMSSVSQGLFETSDIKKPLYQRVLKYGTILGFVTLLFVGIFVGFGAGAFRYHYWFLSDKCVWFCMIVVFPLYVIVDSILNASLFRCSVRAALLPLFIGVSYWFGINFSLPNVLVISSISAIIYIILSMTIIGLTRFFCIFAK